jgi:NADP-dependent aldehyde dehydrogenase
MTQFLGHNYIGGQRSAKGTVTLHSPMRPPAKPCPTISSSHPAGSRRRRPGCRRAYPAYRALSAARRAQFLDAIADELDALSDHFI